MPLVDERLCLSETISLRLYHPLRLIADLFAGGPRFRGPGSPGNHSNPNVYKNVQKLRSGNVRSETKQMPLVDERLCLSGGDTCVGRASTTNDSIASSPGNVPHAFQAQSQRRSCGESGLFSKIARVVTPAQRRWLANWQQSGFIFGLSCLYRRM